MSGAISSVLFCTSVAFCAISTGQTYATDGQMEGTGRATIAEVRHTLDQERIQIFPFVGYVTMTPQTAFMEGVDEPVQVGDVPKTDDPLDRNKITVSGFVPRPIGSICLDSSGKLASRSGEPLSVPANVQPETAGRSSEEHISTFPWQRRHPPRSTVVFRHNPLYFEDPNLERCGHSAGCLTEAVNVLHFAGRAPMLPYLICSNSPCKCVRSLPDCPSCQAFGTDAYIPEPTAKAIAIQAAATAGAAFLIP